MSSCEAALILLFKGALGHDSLGDTSIFIETMGTVSLTDQLIITPLFCAGFIYVPEHKLPGEASVKPGQLSHSGVVLPTPD